MIRGAARRGLHLAHRVTRRLGRTRDLWNERQWEHDRLAFASAIPDAELTALLRRMAGCTFSEYCLDQSRRTMPRSFVPANREQVVATLKAQHADEVTATVAAADTTLAGIFDVLGSGPVNLSRRRGGPGAIDWRRDPITGRRYPAAVSHWRAQVPGTYAAVGGDIKGPWEIGRCQHLPTMGQAYWLTGDNRYAQAFAATIDDFITHNPAGFGVQWGCAMDVGLRVVSWIMALDFFQGAPALTTRWWARFLRSLVEHGRFIAANLEFGTLDGRIATSNHYLADVFGLYWIATTFPELDSNVAWRGLSEHALEREVQVQLHDDGTSFESSVPYHRLVTEMFLSAYALSLKHGRPFAAPYVQRVAKALAFARAIRQPGGRVPQIGDADNGRAHILSQYGRWRQESMDHLLAAGARVMAWPDLARGVEAVDAVEAMFWDVSAPVADVPEVQSAQMLFPDFGLGIISDGGSLAFMTNGRVGTHGFGNHKHCDQLAVELVVGNQPVFVDGGNYVYTSDPEARNHFRGTTSHNTVSVDGIEQHEFKREWLFRMFQTGSAELEAGADAGTRWLAGWHSGYDRLSPSLCHRRRLSVNGAGTIVIEDQIDGGTSHSCRWQFLLHPSVQVQSVAPATTLQWDGGSARFDIPGGLTIDVTDGWYSPAYGRRIPTKSIVCTATEVAGPVTFVLTPRP
jgi:hypothetical protein